MGFRGPRFCGRLRTDTSRVDRDPQRIAHAPARQAFSRWARLGGILRGARDSAESPPTWIGAVGSTSLQFFGPSRRRRPFAGPRPFESALYEAGAGELRATSGRARGNTHIRRNKRVLSLPTQRATAKIYLRAPLGTAGGWQADHPPGTETPALIYGEVAEFRNRGLWLSPDRGPA